jgi:hypothetical protein
MQARELFYSQLFYSQLKVMKWSERWNLFNLQIVSITLEALY